MTLEEKQAREQLLDELSKMPPVKPQPKIGHWIRTYSEELINKVKKEIKEEASFAYADFDRYKEEIYGAEPDELPLDDFRYGLNRAIEIIDECLKEAADEDCD